ncbi:MAG: non-heme iron oxygenase ferredoxin subunit [Gemmatimonadota bacterium]|jgi:3-phenylpropionate/trans-cinnamate dioxygenase ferredoxin subunit
MADGWVRAASLQDVPPGSLKGVEVEGERIALANVDGDVYALEDRCSHQDFPLSDGELEDGKLECIYHGARFDVCDGRAIQLPAIRPVKTWDVVVRDGDIFIQKG